MRCSLRGTSLQPFGEPEEVVFDWTTCEATPQTRQDLLLFEASTGSVVIHGKTNTKVSIKLLTMKTILEEDSPLNETSCGARWFVL